MIIQENHTAQYAEYEARKRHHFKSIQGNHNAQDVVNNSRKRHQRDKIQGNHKAQDVEYTTNGVNTGEQ